MSHSHIYLLSGFPRAVLGNGLGRYVCQLQRITIKFCKSWSSSRGVRDFIEHDLVEFAEKNPNIVIYTKPRRHRSPVFVAEYLNGERKWMSAHNFSRDEVIMWIKLFKCQSGIPEARIRKVWHTDNPSIQGPWSPFLFQNPEFNTSKFPNEKFSSPINLVPSATETLLELFKNQKLNENMNNEQSSENPIDEGEKASIKA